MAGNVAAMTGLTQHDRVLQMLDAAEAVCSTDFLRAYIPRAGARVWDLRQEGYVIETRRCRRPGHAHRTRQIEYVLLAAPGRPRQAELALEDWLEWHGPGIQAAPCVKPTGVADGR